jgi:hypothetical protein
MGVQAIYQHIFPEVLGKTKVLYFPMTTVDVSKTLWSFFQKLRGRHFFIHYSRPLASGENVIVFKTKLLRSNRMEEMEVMYMKDNTKVCMYKIPIKQLTNNESSDHYLPCSCRM